MLLQDSSLVKLVRLDSLKCGEVGFEVFLSMSAELLRSGYVSSAIVVDESGKIVNNGELCDVLRRLGCVKAPVISQGEITRHPNITLEELGFYEDINPEPMRVFKDTVELLYRNWPTPLARLSHLSTKSLSVWGKLEWYNPYSCSIKDRIAWYMLRDAVSRLGGVERLRAIYEATSTNTGLALAALSNVAGVKARLYLPSTAQQCVDYIFRLMGAEVVRGRASITVEMIDDVKKDALRDGALNLNQFENDRNFEVHLRYTAKELDLQVRSAGLRLAAIVGGLGTSGHLSALSHYFKNRYGDHVKIIGVQPARGEVIPGIRRVESGMKWVHLVKIDKIYEVTLKEALEEVINTARKDGILVGLSSGAVLRAVSNAVEEEVVSEGDVVAVLPDHGLKYIEIIEKCVEYQDF
ncbi:MAG: pyridoxal-phosphate dependent enzyme [Desulfurococcaceae archaeon]|jgi:cysteine synthase/O-phosphoserine sulfhydrylase/cystathionine beta-synthase|nr:pyridoxal-phosphate dependent enzyme [Desulfurococcaceae archaeon]